MAESYMELLKNYIRKNINKGYTLSSLKWALINQGYSRTEVTKAIRLVNEELSKKAPKLIEKPVIKVEIEQILPEDISPEKSLWEKIKDFFKD